MRAKRRPATALGRRRQTDGVYDDVEAWVRAGLYDPAAPAAEDRLALLEFLANEGATLEEMVAANERGRLFGLAGDRLIWPADCGLTVGEAAAEAELDVEEVRRVCSALGLHLPPDEAPVLGSADVEALRTYVALRGMVGSDAALGILRVVGAGTARIAEAAATTMRSQVDEIALGRSGSEFRSARAFRDVAALVPRLGGLLDLVHRRHIEEARRHLEQLVDDDRGLLCGIGFADLSGFTALSEVLSVDELSTLLSAFESTTSVMVYDAGARVVKFIGDAVMFTAPTPECLLDVATGLLSHPDAARAQIGVRAAVTWGPVLAQDGDYFGPTVNLAARLLSVARSGEVLAGPSLGELLDPTRWRSEQLGPQRLRGFDRPVVPLRVTRA